MIYHQAVDIPIIIESVDLKTLNLTELFDAFSLHFRSIKLFTGEKISAALARKLAEMNSGDARIEIHDHVQHQKERVDAFLQQTDFSGVELIIGVGGGKVLDVAKYIAAQHQLNYLAVPTIISNDGVASPISVLKGPEHDISLPAHTPMGILIDYDVIETSDRYHTLSGIGDIVSNLSAIRDWDLAIEKGKARPNNFARLLSQSAVDTIITRSPDAQNRQFLESFVHAIILCGLAMNISGDSRPCSGAEHLIAHTLHQLQLSRESHGFLVGSITPYTLWLHGVRDATLFRYFIANRFEYNFDRLANIQPDLGGVLETARTIRGERYTILDAFSTDVLLGQYHDFLEFMDAL